INDVDAEALEAALDSAADVGGRTVRAETSAAGINTEAEFGGDDYAIAWNFAQEFANELFVGPWAVNLGGVEKVAAEFEVTMKDAEGFGFIGGTVGKGHAHTTEAESGDCRAVFAKFSGLHLELRK